MRRGLAVFAVVSLVATSVEAHFIFLVPERLSGPKVRAIFSDNLNPGEPKLLGKISATRLWVRDSAGEESRLIWTMADEGFVLDVPGEGMRTIGGSCVYGVIDRGGKKVLVHYHPKLILGDTDKNDVTKPWSSLPLEIVPTVSKEGMKLQVLQKGKPVGKVELTVFVPGNDTAAKFTTKAEGALKLDLAEKGTYGFVARYTDATPGTYDGRPYDEVHHYATLVLDFASARL